MTTPIPHRFTRPDWLCTECGEPWPCPPRRQALLDECAEAPTAVRTLMYALLGDAIEDLPGEPVEKLWTRFVGWVRTGTRNRASDPSGTP